MIRLEGPIRDHLEDPASDERVARLEQQIGARRLGRGRPARHFSIWAPAAAFAAIGAIVVYLFFSDTPPPPPEPAPSFTAIEPAREPQDPYFGASITAEPPSALSWTRSDAELMYFELGAGARAELDIPADTGRRWVIDAGLARIEASDTTFVITRAADRVAIEVERGLVRVNTSTEEKLLATGERFEVRANVEPPKKMKTTARKTKADDFWVEADAARGRGEHQRAVDLLAQIVAEHPTDDRAGLASFVRARILQDVLARPREAAEAIQLALQLGLAEDLRESARGRLFEAHVAAKDEAAARRAAFEYLANYPEGRHAAAAKRLAGVDSR